MCFDWFKKLRLFVNVRNRKIDVVINIQKKIIWPIKNMALKPTFPPSFNGRLQVMRSEWL
jgi:hypothetical protein